VQQLRQVGVGEHGLREVVVGLEGGSLLPSAEERVQLADGRFGPDAEPADVAAGRQTPQVQLLHVEQGDAGNVTEGLTNAVVPVVDDARTQPRHATTVAHLTFARAEAPARADLLDVLPSADLSQQSYSLLRLLKGLDLVVDDQRHFRDLLDLVTLGHDQGGYARGGDGAAEGISLLVGVDAVMPAAPRLGRSEHPTPAAHVTERALTGSVRPAASDPGNPGHGSSGSPGGGRRLFSRPHVDAVRLPGILHHFVVDERHDVRADGGFENCRQVDAFVWNRR